GEVAALRMLKHALGLRSATVRKTHVLFIDGKQKTALNAFLRHRNITHLTPQKLSQLEHPFGLRNTAEVEKGLRGVTIERNAYKFQKQ
ncbi:MAG: hypothetical protein QW478_04945, partial [Candidatus Micrarchaeaceae archaeon]